MDELKSWLDLLYEGKQKRGFYVTPTEIWQLDLIAKGIIKEFISLTIHDVLEKCGISVREKGIGWEVI